MPIEAAALALRAEPERLRQVLRFNLQPALDADPARLAALVANGPDEAGWRLLLGAPRLAARLSRFLLARLGLDRAFCYDFSAARRRLALLPRDELERLARHAGAFLHAGAISRVIARDAMRSLREAIGEDAYRFAVRRAGFMGVAEQPLAGRELKAAIESDGLACLGHWLAGEPRAVAERARLRLPPHPALDAPHLLAGGPDAALAGRVLDKVLKEGDPAWRVYCG